MGSYIATVSPGEARLIERLREREEGAFCELFNRFSDRIYQTAIRILKEHQAAQDALQETCVNVFRSAHRFRGDSRVGTWINRITVNVCLEMIRKNRKHDQRIDPDVSEQTQFQDHHFASPYESCRRRELSRRVHIALRRLGPKHQPIVRMHDLEGYTIREIAEMTGVAEGTVKSRLFYGRQELKRLLQAEELPREAA